MCPGWCLTLSNCCTPPCVTILSRAMLWFCIRIVTKGVGMGDTRSAICEWCGSSFVFNYSGKGRPVRLCSDYCRKQSRQKTNEDAYAKDGLSRQHRHREKVKNG